MPVKLIASWVDISLMTDSGTAADARVATLYRTLAEHPLAAVAAMDDDGLITALPGALASSGFPTIEKRWLVELVVAGDRVAIAGAWEAVRRDGTSTVFVTFRNGQRAEVHWIDVRDRFGVFVAVVAADDGSILDFAGLSDADDITPRYGIARRNEGGNIVEADPAVSRLVGWSNEELTSAQAISHIHPDDQERAIENWLETLAAPDRDTRWRGRHLRADGEYVWLEFTNCNRLADPDYCGVRSEMLDISDEMAMNEALRNSEARFRRLAEALPLGLAQIDEERRIVYANRPFAAIVGTEPSTFEAAFSPSTADEAQRLDEAMDAALQRGAHAEVEISIRTHALTSRVIHVIARPLNEESQGPSHAIVVVADVTDRTMMRTELERRANFDALTRCYNRSTILSLLDGHLGSRRPSTGTAVIFVDLDRFKPVNDRLGHAAGDELLMVVAQRMRDAVRDDDVVGRLGGDEFLVICPHLDDPATATEIAERIAATLKTDLTIDGTRVPMCASVGVAWTDDDAADADSLVRRADAAMYRSKRLATGTPVVDSAVPNRAA